MSALKLPPVSPLGLAPPKEWAPQTPKSRESYNLGLELLLTSPIALIATPSARSVQTAERACLAIWSAPASALWSSMDKNQWRSLCCQAMDLSAEQLASALQRVLARRLDDYPRWGDWKAHGGAVFCEWSHTQKTQSKGFAYAANVRLRTPGPMSEEQESAFFLTALATAQDWFKAGWIDSVPLSDFNPWAWSAPRNQISAFAKLCQSRCHASVWEARELSECLAPSAPSIKRVISV